MISRFNLQAYSIDNGPFIPINRISDGNFTLDVITDSDHSVFFFAKPQFQYHIHGINNELLFHHLPQMIIGLMKAQMCNSLYHMLYHQTSKIQDNNLMDGH